MVTTTCDLFNSITISITIGDHTGPTRVTNGWIHVHVHTVESPSLNKGHACVGASHFV